MIVGDGDTIVAAADPVTLTGTDVGRYAVYVNANDIAVTGVRPRWFLATVLFPVGVTEAEVVEVFEQMRAALDEVGAVLAGGHTEVTPAVSQTVVAGQMIGTTASGRYVTTSGARPGDAVVQIGMAPVEGAAVLASTFASRLPVDIATRAAQAIDDPGISVVAAALAAAELGATALHDPTEGGIAAGLHELAVASGAAVRLDRDAVPWFGPGRAVCEVLGADPWATIASGCVLAAFPGAVCDSAVARLRELGHVAAVIGSVERGQGVLDRAGRPLAWPARDEVARLLDERA